MQGERVPRGTWPLYALTYEQVSLLDASLVPQFRNAACSPQFLQPELKHRQIAPASLPAMDTAKHAARLFPLRPALVLVACSLGVLVAQIDASDVTLAVKRIGADLGSPVSEMQG